MSRDSFIFYRSFYEAIKDLPEPEQLKVYSAIAEYSLNFKEPKLTGLSNTIFKLIKPQIAANIAKYKNGCKGAVHGVKGGRPKTPKKPLRKPQKNPKQTPNVNDNENVNVSFSEFWELYDRKVGDKNKLEKKWSSLTDKDRIDIMQYLPRYVRSTPDKQFRKHPLTFLNNKSWNDEILDGNIDTPVRLFN